MISGPRGVLDPRRSPSGPVHRHQDKRALIDHDDDRLEKKSYVHSQILVNSLVPFLNIY